MVEKDIENKIKIALNQSKIYYVKIHGGMYQTPGVPDLIINFDGHFVGVEVKKFPQKPTELQKHHLNQISNGGGISIVVDEKNVRRLVEIIKDKNYEEVISFSRDSIELFGLKK